MHKENKRIVINTGIMYGRLIVVTIVGLLISRYVLLALGASDFGLYSVVGGLIAMLNVLSTAMQTTTRRFINVEMGKPDGNLNRIFNISRLLHIGFALFIFLVAETVGLFYIYNYMKVEPGKLSDAIFVFQVSTTAAAISIVNVPYQAMLEANEKFSQIALYDICQKILMLVFVMSLSIFNGNTLRIYAVGMSSLTLISLSFYNIACFVQWREIVKYKFYRDFAQYKEILFFNNYVALGATAYMSRTQASNMLVNFFFGTLVNAAFAIGYAVESYCMMFVSNIGSAATPQITRNYENNQQRSFYLTAMLNRISVYLVLLLIVPLSLELDFVLKLWLKNVPEGAHIVCQLTLVSAFTRILFGSKDKIVQASGKIRWFQITGSILDVSCIPISYVLFKFGYPAYTIVAVYVVCTVVHGFWTFFLMKILLKFDVLNYVKMVYIPVGLTSIGILAVIFGYSQIKLDSFCGHFFGIALSGICCSLCIYFLGLNKDEKNKLTSVIKNKVKRK